MRSGQSAVVRSGGIIATAAMLAGLAVAQEAEQPSPPLPPQARADVIPAETTIGALHAAGYIVGDIYTVPATDAAVNRFAFVMDHPEGAARPLYVCRLMVGSGLEDTAQFPLIMTNICARLP
ncbi:MAG: hypothetical protein ACFBRM_10440 [Pikeienuella sp.]